MERRSNDLDLEVRDVDKIKDKQRRLKSQIR